MAGLPTVREFFEPILKEYREARDWFEYCLEERHPVTSDEFMTAPVDRGPLLRIADWIWEEARFQLDYVGSKGRYEAILKEYHGFMGAVYEKAHSLTIHVERQELDRPVSYTEMMAVKGLIEMTPDGMVELSAAGRQLVEVMERNAAGETRSTTPVRFRVIKTPSGLAPEQVKQGWIGIELEGVPTLGAEPQCDFTTSRLIEGKPGYVVLADEALDTLAMVDPSAVDWFRQWFPRGSGKHLVFDQEVTEPVA